MDKEENNQLNLFFIGKANDSGYDMKPKNNSVI